jgi:hypothetical protein
MNTAADRRRRTLMTSMTPTKSPLGLNSTVWILIVAVLLIAIAAIVMYSR